MPAISVLMSTYKEPIEWLRQSIDSILCQTFKDFEFIIVCDNPEYTEAITLLKEYAARDIRIILLFNNENIGLTKSLNKGLQIVRGKYVARMDADDISDSRRLQVQYSFLESNPGVAICGTGRKILNGNQNSKKSYNTYTTHNELLSVFVLISIFVHPTVMFRRDIVDKGMRYDETVECAQDVDFWERLVENGFRLANIKQPLIWYRKSEQQVSRRRNTTQINNSREVIKRFLRYLGIEISGKELEIMSYPSQNDLTMTIAEVEKYAKVLEKVYNMLSKKEWFDKRAYQTEAIRYLLNLAVKSNEKIESMWQVLTSPLLTPYSLTGNIKYYISRL